MRTEILHGIAVIVSPYLTVKVTTQHERAWDERLFSWPWCPWRKFKSVTITKPNPNAMMMNVNGEQTLIMHPQTFALLQEKFRGSNENQGTVYTQKGRMALACLHDEQHEDRRQQ